MAQAATPALRRYQWVDQKFLALLCCIAGFSQSEINEENEDSNFSEAEQWEADLLETLGEGSPFAKGITKRSSPWVVVSGTAPCRF